MLHRSIRHMVVTEEITGGGEVDPCVLPYLLSIVLHPMTLFVILDGIYGMRSVGGLNELVWVVGAAYVYFVIVILLLGLIAYLSLCIQRWRAYREHVR